MTGVGRMRRREFLGVLGGAAAAWSLVAPSRNCFDLLVKIIVVLLHVIASAYLNFFLMM
jgi:hypothetical protein